MNNIIVGSSIVGNGDSNDAMFRVDTMNEAIDELIKIIEEERESIERERASNAHWKYIDCFKFFIGTLSNDRVVPSFDSGSWGEILVEGVDIIIDIDKHIDDDFDFDAIIEDLKSKKQ